MPRAILAQSAQADRSRTMSSVSDELGVSPSTLRTWERRYGLGPAQREAGERRRYHPEDVDRLRAMIHHVRAGMSAAEAAKRALAESALLPRRGPANAAQLRSVALSDDYHRLEEVIEAAVASHGLVHTWSRFVEPTLKSLRSAPGGEPIGSAPALMLVNAFQRVCRSVYQSRPARSLVGGDRVALISDSLHETAVQVIGVALAWYGCDVRVLSSSRATECPRSWWERTPPRSSRPRCSACAPSAPVSRRPSPSSRPRPTWSSSAAPDACDGSRAIAPSTARSRPLPPPAVPGQVIP